MNNDRDETKEILIGLLSGSALIKGMLRNVFLQWLTEDKEVRSIFRQAFDVWKTENNNENKVDDWTILMHSNET